MPRRIDIDGNGRIDLKELALVTNTLQHTHTHTQQHTHIRDDPGSSRLLHPPSPISRCFNRHGEGVSAGCQTRQTLPLLGSLYPSTATPVPLLILPLPFLTACPHPWEGAGTNCCAVPSGGSVGWNHRSSATERERAGGEDIIVHAANTDHAAAQWPESPRAHRWRRTLTR